jgi:hypothetical protein
LRKDGRLQRSPLTEQCKKCPPDFGSPISTDGEQGIDTQQGYGYQFYLCRHGYTARGEHGQFIIVLLEQDAVIAITSDVKNMQDVLDLVGRIKINTRLHTVECQHAAGYSLTNPD